MPLQSVIPPSGGDCSQGSGAAAPADLSAAVRSGTIELTVMVGFGIVCWLGLAILVLVAVKGAAA